jgi:hypothetical protein
MSNTVGPGSRATPPISAFSHPRIWRDFSHMLLGAIAVGVAASAIMVGIVLLASRL